MVQAVPALDSHPPLTIPGYRLLHPLGQGGMGEVWAAEHVETGLAVAVKWLHRAEPEGLAREVRAIARLDHPNILRIYDQGAVDGRPYFVMAQAEGVLPAVLLPWPQLQGALLVLLDALAHAHARGVIHRDLKPANLLHAEGQILLADFGISALLEESGESRVSGSLPYMAPEQLAGRWREIGPWTDLFALGCVAFELSVGRRLFPTADAPRTFHPAFHPTLAQTPGLGAWLARMLAHAPHDRFQCAADAAHALIQLSGAPLAPARLLSFAAAVPPSSDAAQSEATMTIWTTAEPAAAPSPAPAGDTAGAGAADGVPPCPADWRRPPHLRVPPRGLGLGLYMQRRIPLAGRVAERTQLWSLLRQLHADGGARVVALRGAPGVGKSHVASWLLERAAEVGAAHSIQARGGTAGALRAALLRWLRAAGLRGAALVEQLHSVLPAAAHGLIPDLVAEDAGPREVVKLLARLSLARPVILWLDDAHQCAELDVLLAEVRHAGEAARLLVVLTLPDTAAEAAWDEALVLGPLSAPDQLLLVEELLFLEEQFALQLLRHTGGEPGFVTALVRSLIEQDLLESGENGFRLRAGASLALPTDLGALWLARLATSVQPDSAAWLLLERAATQGAVVDRQLWGLASEAHGEIARIEQQLLARGLVDEEEEGFRWRGSALPVSLEQHARAAGRWTAHCCGTAAAIEARCAAMPKEDRAFYWMTRAVVARLWLEGGAPERACPELIWAIHHDRTRNDWRAIPQWIEQIEQIVAELALPEAHPWRLQGMMYRSLERGLHGFHHEAAELLERIRLCKQGRWIAVLENEFLSLGLVHARSQSDLGALRWWRAQILSYPERLTSVVLWANALLIKLLAADAAQHRAEIDAVIAETMAEPAFWDVQGRNASSLLMGWKLMADALVMLGDLERARHIIEDMLERLGRLLMARPLQRILSTTRSRFLDSLAEIAFLQGDPSESATLIAESLEILEAEQQRNAAATRAELGLMALYCGDLEAAGYHLRRARLELERQGNHRYLRTMQPCLLGLAVLEDRPEDAEALLVEMESWSWPFHRYALWLQRVAALLVARCGVTAVVRRCWRLELAQQEAIGDQARCAVLRAQLEAAQGS